MIVLMSTGARIELGIPSQIFNETTDVITLYTGRNKVFLVYIVRINP